MRAVLCALLCNCRHALRADDDECLVAVALEHLRRYHPVAPIGEERVREIVTARAYEMSEELLPDKQRGATFQSDPQRAKTTG
jgi:predicted small metal-binding protein